MSVDDLAKLLEQGLTSGSLLVLALSALGALLGALFGGYLKKKGEHHAAREDFKEALTQLKATTVATEEIRLQSAKELTLATEAIKASQQVDRLIHDSIVSAYEQLDLHINEFVELIDDEILSGKGSDRSIRRLHSFSRVEALVRLWLPALDVPLETLKASIQVSQRHYHAILTDLNDVRRERDRADETKEEEIAQEITDPTERQEYQAVSLQFRKEATKHLVERLCRYSDIARAFPHGIEFDKPSIEIIEKLLRHQALALLGAMDAKTERFKIALTTTSREFLGQRSPQK